MKKRQLFMGAFAIVLAFTMVLSVYTRVKADDPTAFPDCVTSYGPVSGTRPGTPTGYDCYVCEYNGAPKYYTIDDITYEEQDRQMVDNTVYLTHCDAFPNSVCSPDYANPQYNPGGCDNIITVVGTGTN